MPRKETGEEPNQDSKILLIEYLNYLIIIMKIKFNFKFVVSFELYILCYFINDDNLFIYFSSDNFQLK